MELLHGNIRLDTVLLKEEPFEDLVSFQFVGRQIVRFFGEVVEYGVRLRKGCAVV